MYFKLQHLEVNMDYKLENKTALVTGSTAGIGFSIAKMLADEGVNVIINGRTEERVNSAIDTIKSFRPHAKLIPCVIDLSTKEGSTKLFQQIPQIDILVNNLEIYEVKAFNEITDEDWLNIFNVNVMSGIRLSRQYLPSMLKNNWGRIIFISSESGVQIPIEMIHYGMTKSAQIAIARGLAEMTAGSGVTVNSVLPGPTQSEGVKQFIETLGKERALTAAQIEKDLFSKDRPSSLLKRLATTDEVAAMVTYLCSPLSAATNGAAVRVDGGVVRSIV